MLLEIKNLTIGYPTEKGLVKAVNGVDFTVEHGQVVGLVGESGCGKSTALFSIIGLVSPPGRVVEGEILFEGKDLTHYKTQQWQHLRGKEIAMIYQDPMTTLNPAFRVGEQIREVLKTHRESGKWWDGGKIRQEEKQKVLKIMEEVGIPDPESRYNEYPHQFSGGMQQRALIAMALAGEPKLLLADEPTTALDVTIQAQILDLLKKINRDRGTSVILVTHDLAVASEFCDELAVMYAGRIVERGPTAEIIEDPKHPYTQGLLKSIPRISKERAPIEPIRGNVIDLLEAGEGCEFAPRCPYATEQCLRPVEMTNLNDRHQVRCVLHGKGSDKNDTTHATRA